MIYKNPSLIFILLFIWLTGCSTPKGSQVCYQDKCFSVEVARTEVDRQKGLQGREQLAKDKGMLFVFPVLYPYAFWMKDTLIPLDMIWLDSDGRIVFIAENVPPCESDPCPTYQPTEKARYVLEIKAGQVQELGMKVTDQLRFNVQGF